MFYPAKFESAPEGGYVVTFRDIPEAITQGDTDAEAEEMATDVLLSAMDFYFEDRRLVPMPSKPQEGERLIALPASIWAKVLLLNELVAARVSNSELARRLDTRPQDVQRIIDLGHVTKIDTLARAFSVLGKHLEIRVV
ncbi:MAG: type II toxin-antitoxin system HicB family antitoxin [Acidobacteriota bacterium]|jgi:antitoxin HicB|nr:type II toxin-antitoxin system HicB family antitoxin [Acidobacteriota bacterium]